MKKVFLALGKKMRQVYTENERGRFIEDYEKSSLSIKDYCQSRNISTCFYYHWKKPAQVSGLSMTLPNGIRIGLDA
jgi:hypothetical protein